MKFLSNLLPDLGTGTDFSTGQRDVNLNKQFIDNTAYDKLKGGEQYEAAPEGLVWDANRGHYVKQGSPTGLLGGALGILDWANLNYSDWDRAGTGKDKYGNLPEAGTLGGQRVKINPKMKNTEYNQNLPSYGDPYNPVPQIPTSKSYKDRIYDDIYSQVVDRWRMGGALNQAFEINKQAQDYSAYLDAVQMQRAQNSPFGQSRMATEQQARMALASTALSDRIRARAASQTAANQFGELGLRRTYFTG
tara:strand:- start:1678 stop:2421 length:744 start_codon:yes stop_codon:yes gene_type:complete